jgi:hypothetical protein
MATETASHILYERVALAEFRFGRLGNLFWLARNYEEISFCKVL